MNDVIRSVYAKEIADLRDRPGASGRVENVAEVGVRVAEAARRGARAGGLRPHQAEALKEIGAHFAKSKTRSLVVIPAAGEKRHTFVAAIEEIGAGGRKIGGRPWFPNTVVLTPSIDSIGVILREIRAARPDIKEVGYMASRKVADRNGKPIEPGFGLVTVMTYARFRELAKERAIVPGDVDLLVMDEAHEGLSEMRQTEIAPFLGTAVVTAFTGTPAFDDFKSVHRLLGEDSEVYSISARELRNRGEIPPIMNYLMGVPLTGEGPTDGPRVTAVKRKALVDGVLHHLFEGDDPALSEALAGRVALFYGADRAHAEMFAREYDNRYRRDPDNAYAAMAAYRRKVERETGRRHDPKTSVLRDEVLRQLARNTKLTDCEFKQAWMPLPIEMRSATDPKDLKKHIEALVEAVATMPTPMEFIDGTKETAKAAEVMARVRSGEVRFLSSAQMLDGMEIPNVGVVINTPTESLLRCLQQGAQVQRGRGTGFVLNPFYRINGQVDGFPRFFYEASDDMEMGEPVEFNPRYFDEVDLTGYEPEPEEDKIEAREAAALGDAGEDLDDPTEGFDFGVDLEDEGEVEEVDAVPAGRPAQPGPKITAPAGRAAPPRGMPPAAGASARPASARPASAPQGGRTAAFVAAPVRTFAGARSAVVPAYRPQTSRAIHPGTDRRPIRPAPMPAPAPFGRYESKEAKIDAIVRLIKQRDLFRKARAPDPGYLSQREFCARMAVPSSQSGKVSRVYSELKEALVQGRDPVYDGLPVDAQAFRDGHLRWIGIRIADADRIGRALGYHPNLPSRSAKWLSVVQVGGRIGSTGHPLILEIFQDLAADWTKTGRAATPHFSMLRDGKFALHEDGLDWFRGEFARRRPAPKQKGEMGLRDACFRIGVRSAARAEAVWKAAAAALGNKVPVDRSEDVPFRRALDNGREVEVLGEAGLAWFARKLGVPYHGVVEFDPRFHARLEDALGMLEAKGAAAEKLKAAYARFRQTHEAGRPVTVDGAQVSATLLRRLPGESTEGFALAKDCLVALARELRIEVPQPELAEEDEPEPGLAM